MNRPTFIIDTEMPERGYTCAALIEKGIVENPESYIEALGSIVMEKILGDDQLPTDADEPSEQQETDTSAVLAARLLIDEYVEENYGRYVEYDEETEAALDHETTYQDMIRELQSQKAQVLQRNKTTIRIENPHAEGTRQLISEYLLGYFTLRFITWQAETEAKQEPLPEAS